MLNIVRKCTVECIWSNFWPTIKKLRYFSGCFPCEESSSIINNANSHFIKLCQNFEKFIQKEEKTWRKNSNHGGPIHMLARPVAHQYTIVQFWNTPRNRGKYFPFQHAIMWTDRTSWESFKVVPPCNTRK